MAGGHVAVGKHRGIGQDRLFERGVRLYGEFRDAVARDRVDGCEQQRDHDTD